jgi:hypothetical protein
MGQEESSNKDAVQIYQAPQWLRRCPGQNRQRALLASGKQLLEHAVGLGFASVRGQEHGLTTISNGYQACTFRSNSMDPEMMP